MFLVVPEELEQKWQARKKKSGSKAAALQKEFSTRSILSWDKVRRQGKV